MPEIRIIKSERILELWDEGELKKKYEVGLGFTPEGRKEKEGDGKSPEGEYYVCTKNKESKFTLFLGLSYPNVVDAEKGLEKGLITREEFDNIADANKRKVRPDWETGLGGKIGIHGKGGSFDWTAGCIAMDDDDIRDLWKHIEKGDRVIIQP